MGTSRARRKCKVVKSTTLSSINAIKPSLKCQECQTRKLFTTEELAEHIRIMHAKCICCQSSHKTSAKTLMCSKGHSLCAACTKHFVGSQLTSKTYPMTCSICKVEVPACDIHRLLNNNELESYTNLAISRNLIGNEVLFTCQNVKCEAACILEMGPCNGHSPDYTSTWVRCFDCRVLTCAICLQTSTRVIKKHSAECAELCEIKRAFETAVAEGAAFRCPKCKLAGRKDTGCNSIYCLQCHTNWCYVCGKAQDKSHGCAAHGYGAVTANKLDDLHRERTLQLLRQVYTGCNSQLFRKVWDRFPSIPAHGFSWVEITGSPYK